MAAGQPPWAALFVCALASITGAYDAGGGAGGGGFNLLPQQNPILLQAEGPRTGQKIHSIEKPSYTLASDDVVFVSGFWSNQVAMIHNNKEITVFAAGDGLDGPWGLAESNGTLFVSSFATDTVHQYSIATGELLARIGNELELDCPEGLAFSPDGDLFVVSFLRHEVIRYSAVTGKFLGVAASGSELVGPEDVVCYNGGVLVTSHYTDSINRYGPAGEFLGVWASIEKPVGLTIGFDAHVYVASYGTHSIVRFNGRSGQLMDIFASGGDLRGPSSLSFGTYRLLYVSSYENDRVVLYNSTANVAVTVSRKLYGRDRDLNR